MVTLKSFLSRSLFVFCGLWASTLLVACDEAAPGPVRVEDAGLAFDGGSTTNVVTQIDGGVVADGPGTAADGGTADGPDPSALTSSRGRLLVADNDPENPRVLVVDLDDGAVVGRFPTLGTARAYSSAPGSGYAYAVQGVPGLVEIFGSGISASPAGGLVKGAPFALDARFRGPRPVHWVEHDSWVVSFNDGDGSFDYLLETTLGTNRTLMQRAATGIAHHGVAVIWHGNVIATHAIPDPADATKTVRTGVTIRKLATPDVVVETVGGCPGLHGEAANDHSVAFGCADGILLGQRESGKLAFRKLAHPEGKAIGTLKAKDGVPRLIGNLRDAAKGYDVGFVVVSHADATPIWTPVDLGARSLGFLFETVGTRLVVLGGDGTLRLHDPMTGASIGAPLPVVEAYTSGTAPGLAIGAAAAFVLDPRSGKVIEVDLAGWRVGRTFMVGGQPISAAAFGLVSSARTP
jgi:hypothetical protein